MLFIKAQGQNLVPNSSFEIVTPCPTNLGQLTNAYPWFVPNGSGGTPDLFNSCSNSVPQNMVGYQDAHSGNGYAGISIYNYWYNGSDINNREYIAVQLNDTLIAGKKYCVEFYASLADSSFWAINRFGACLSKHPLSGQAFDTISAIPQIVWDTNSIFLDKTDWVLISGTYIASGGEHYITIGNFYADNQTDTVSHLGGSVASYFYIDDVSVTDCGWSGIQSSVLQPNISLFPNPATTNVTFRMENFEGIKTLIIYDQMGKEIWRKETSEMEIEFSTDGFATGLYFYRVEKGQSILGQGKLIIE